MMRIIPEAHVIDGGDLTATGPEGAPNGYSMTGAGPSAPIRWMCTGGMTTVVYGCPGLVDCYIGTARALSRQVIHQAWRLWEVNITLRPLARYALRSSDSRSIPMAPIRPAFWNGRSMTQANRLTSRPGSWRVSIASSCSVVRPT